MSQKPPAWLCAWPYHHTAMHVINAHIVRQRPCSRPSRPPHQSVGRRFITTSSSPLTPQSNPRTSLSCYCISALGKPPWLFFFPTFIPLSLPSFFHIAESRFGLTSLMGGLMGGVIGDSFNGLSVLPLSSVVKPGPRPEAVSEPDDKLASEVADVRS